MQTRIGAFKEDKMMLVYNSIEDVRKSGWSINKVVDCCLGKKRKYHGMRWQYISSTQTNTIANYNIEMKRIQEVTGVKRIELDNVKVSFPIKLLQWQINNLLFNYNNKYAYPHNISTLKKELVDIITKSKIKEDKQSGEILQKARTLYISLHTYIYDIDEKEKAIDDTARYILYTYSKKKSVMTVTQQIEMLTEIKGLLQYISTNNIQPTERISNLSKLAQQLKDTIVAQL